MRARQDLKLRSWINVASIKQSNPRNCSNHCNFPCSRPRFLVVRIVKAKSSTSYVYHADRPLLYELSSSHEPRYHFVYACFREWQRFQLLKNCSVWFAFIHSIRALSNLLRFILWHDNLATFYYLNCMDSTLKECGLVTQTCGGANDLFALKISSHQRQYPSPHTPACSMARSM